MVEKNMIMCIIAMGVAGIAPVDGQTPYLFG